MAYKRSCHICGFTVKKGTAYAAGNAMKLHYDKNHRNPRDELGLLIDIAADEVSSANLGNPSKGVELY